MRERIRQLADTIWRGLDAQEELYKLLREDPKAVGPTEVAELTDHLWRPEHISRIAHGESKGPRKRRKRTAVVDA